MHTFLDTHLFRYYKEVPYFVALSGALKPRYEGSIDHRADVSPSLIRRLSASPENLYELKRTLRLEIPLFARPIYIGFATRLRGAADAACASYRLIAASSRFCG